MRFYAADLLAVAFTVVQLEVASLYKMRDANPAIVSFPTGATSVEFVRNPPPQEKNPWFPQFRPGPLQDWQTGLHFRHFSNEKKGI